VRRALIASFGASGSIQLANVVSGVVLARQLGPSSRGALAAVILWPSLLATVGMLGLPDALTFRAARRDCELGVLLGTGIVIALVQSALLVAAGVALIPLVLAHDGANTVHLGLVFLCFIPLTLLALAVMGVLNGSGEFRAFHLLRVLVTALSVASICVLAGLGALSLASAIITYLAANAITLVVALMIMRKSARRVRFNASLAREMLVFGMKSHTSGVSSMLNERLDQLIISAFLAPAQLGLYVIAVTLTSLTTLVGASVAYVALPVISRIRERDELLKHVRQLVVATVAGSLAISVPLIVFAPRVIEIFFGRAYLPVATVSRILLAAVVMLSVSRALAAMLKGLGRPIHAGLADGIALVVTLAALAALLPVFGLLGAAIASALAYATSLAWMVRRTAAAMGIPARLLVRRPPLWPAVAPGLKS
jgi:O-antigen/teichoic acid export membrane protein